jgi:hypothetical protein
MKGERVVIIGPHEVGIQGATALVETCYKDEQKVVGSTTSFTSEEIGRLKMIEPPPTVAIIQDFGNEIHTAAAVGNVMQLLPNAKIIGMGAGEKIKGADFQLGLISVRNELEKILREL